MNATLRIVQIATANPHLMQVEVAAMMGVTRQRVGQVYKRYNIPSGPRGGRRTRSLPLCIVCNQPPMPRGTGFAVSWKGHRACLQPKVILFCDTCGASFPRNGNLVRRSAKDPRYGSRTFCSQVCYLNRAGGIQPFTCSICGQPFISNDATRRWSIRSGETKRPSCLMPECRRKRVLQHMAEIRAKRAAQRAVS